MNYISVIVTAYNRREYLEDALDSLMEQSEKRFEIVLVTNFQFDLSKYKHLIIKKLTMEGEIGEFLYQGILAASGNIIVFLDDDDAYMPDKIRTIYDQFERKIGYYHNSTYLVRDGQFVKKYGKYAVDFNMSSIALRKNIMKGYMEHLKSLKTAQDHFFYFVALENRVKIRDDKRVLTKYRVHEINSTGNFGTLRNDWLRRYLVQLTEFSNIFKRRLCKRIIKNHSRDATGILNMQTHSKLDKIDIILLVPSYFIQLEYSNLRALLMYIFNFH